MLLKNVTIGSTTESLLYAYLNDNYFLPTLSFGPIFYDKVPIPFLAHSREDITWSRLQLVMALSGKLLNYENIANIKIQGSEIKISTSDGLFKYKFEKCKIFDPTGISLENEIKEKIESVYKVYDDFELSNLGGKHKFLKAKMSSEKLARKIHYYTSDRVDGANYVTDCVAESLLNEEQINDVNFSDSIVRFSVIRHLTSLGIHGTFMNLYKNGQPKYRKPRVTHRERIVIKQEKNKYKDSEHVKFVDLTMQEIIDAFSP